MSDNLTRSNKGKSNIAVAILKSEWLDSTIVFLNLWAPIIFLATTQQKSPNIFPSLYSNQKILSKAEMQWTKVLLDVLLSEMLIIHKSKTMFGIPNKLA